MTSASSSADRPMPWYTVARSWRRRYERHHSMSALWPRLRRWDEVRPVLPGPPVAMVVLSVTAVPASGRRASTPPTSTPENCLPQGCGSSRARSSSSAAGLGVGFTIYAPLPGAFFDHPSAGTSGSPLSLIGGVIIPHAAAGGAKAVQPTSTGDDRHPSVWRLPSRGLAPH